MPHGEIPRVLKLSRSDTSTGPDGILIKFVKMVAVSIPEVDQLKSEEHFRPISILPTLSKVFEKLVALQMTTFCESELVLRDTIYSFRKGRSTNTVLMGMQDDLLRAMKTGEVTLMVLADFSKALDTVNYNILITKLLTLGF